MVNWFITGLQIVGYNFYSTSHVGRGMGQAKSAAETFNFEQFPTRD